MQGYLPETSFYSLIKFLELNQQTGILLVESTIQSSSIAQTKNSSFNYFNSKPYYSLSSLAQPQTWLIFFKNGKIIDVVNEKDNPILQIKDYLSDDSEKTLNDFEKTLEFLSSSLEYSCLNNLLSQGLIPPLKAKKIIKNIIIKNLGQISKLSQGNFIFQPSSIDLITLVDFSPSVLINLVIKELQSWYKLTPYIYSENQYFANCHQEKLKRNLPIDTYQKIVNWTKQKISLERASRQLNCSLVELAKAIYPYLKKSWIELLASDSQNYLKQSVNNHHKTSHIIYIDNDVTNGKNVEYILKQRGYPLTVVQDSIEALSLILKTQPRAILCNVDMPQLTGYQLYNMLQKSKGSRKIPIILVAENENCLALEEVKLIDADDYLIKPFANDKLLALLEKHLGRTEQKQLDLIS